MLKFSFAEGGTKLFPKSKLSTTWKLALQCISSSNRNPFDKMGFVSTTKPVVVPPFSDVTISGLTRVSSLGKTMVITDHDSLHALPFGLVTLPTLQKVNFSTGSSHRLPVQVRNLTAFQITIPAKAVICKLQQADAIDPSECNSPSPEESFLKQFTLNKSLSSSEIGQVEELLLNWKHIFSFSGKLCPWV